MKKLIPLLLFIPLVSFGQDYGNDTDALKLCTAIQANSFTSDRKADNALDRILSVIGASKRFVLQPCNNINNAVATSYKGIRYILYDRDFMNSLDSGDNWSNLFILAHEVGHHINGHSLDILLYAAEAIEPETLANKRKQELEADEFAGFILAKLGATLEQTSLSVNLLSSEKDDTYSTHPSKSKRLESIKIGFNKARGKESVAFEPTKLQTAEEYFYSGLYKADQNDNYGAIADYTKAIEIYPQNSGYYNNRGAAKSNLKDYNAAIIDYNKAIEIDPLDYTAYYNRANTKKNLKDNYGAIADYTKAIEIYPQYLNAYINRGIAKSNLKDYNAAIIDYNKAIEIDPLDYTAYYNRGNSKGRLKDYYGSISDFTRAIELNTSSTSNNSGIYYNRALSKAFLNDMISACEDARKSKSLGYSDESKLNSFINIVCKKN